MSVSFYNANGTMIGADLHDYWTVIPPAPPPVVIPALHFVVATFDGPCDEAKTRPANVTSDGKPMIQKDFKRTFVGPHLPLTAAAPHPSEIMNWLTTVALSGSVALLGVATVTGGGNPLACCVYGAAGANLNCGDPIDLPLNLVINENSVLTQPTDMDFAEAVFMFAMSGLVSLGVGKAFDKLGDGWKSYVKKKIRDDLVVPIRKKAEDIVKDFFNDHVKNVKDKIKGPHKAKAALSALGVTHV